MKLRRGRGGSEEEVVRVMQSENWTCSNAGWRRLQRPPFPPTPSSSYMISPSLLVDCNNYCTLVLGLLFGCHLDYSVLPALCVPPPSHIADIECAGPLFFPPSILHCHLPDAALLPYFPKQCPESPAAAARKGGGEGEPLHSFARSRRRTRGGLAA